MCSSPQVPRNKETVTDCNAKEKSPLISILYVISGLSEDIRRVCHCFNIRVAFKSGQSLWSIFTGVNDKLVSSMHS